MLQYSISKECAMTPVNIYRYPKNWIPPYSLGCVHHPGRMKLAVLQSPDSVHTIWYSSNLEWEMENKESTFSIVSMNKRSQNLNTHFLRTFTRSLRKTPLPLLKTSETSNVWATGTSDFAFLVEGSSVYESSLGDPVLIVPFSPPKR